MKAVSIYKKQNTCIFTKKNYGKIFIFIPNYVGGTKQVLLVEIFKSIRKSQNNAIQRFWIQRIVVYLYFCQNFFSHLSSVSIYKCFQFRIFKTVI